MIGVLFTGISGWVFEPLLVRLGRSYSLPRAVSPTDTWQYLPVYIEHHFTPRHSLGKAQANSEHENRAQWAAGHKDQHNQSV